MKLNDLPHTSPWTLARRAERMNPSVIREILKVTEKPGIISLAGGLPSPKTFPVEAFAAASAAVLANDGPSALQYASSEGFAPLREAIAAFLPWDVDPEQVLITTGSQQGLDLIAKVLIDTDSRVLVETPTYLGAIQAFTPMEPKVVAVASDEQGVRIDDLVAKVGTGADKARFLYVLPNFQNPTGRTMSDARRAELVAKAAELNLPLVEDNPYGDLWFDGPPPAPLTARNRRNHDRRDHNRLTHRARREPSTSACAGARRGADVAGGPGCPGVARPVPAFAPPRLISRLVNPQPSLKAVLTRTSPVNSL